MSSLPNEIFSDITNFLPNDDITDLMLMSRNFNVFVTWRLQKIDKEMATMNQSVDTFMPSPTPEITDNEWISQLNLKKFEPVGTEAMQRWKDFFENPGVFLDCLYHWVSFTFDTILGRLYRLKERMSMKRFDDPTFLRILGVLVAIPTLRQKYNVRNPSELLNSIHCLYTTHFERYQPFDDVIRIRSFYEN